MTCEECGREMAWRRNKQPGQQLAINKGQCGSCYSKHRHKAQPAPPKEKCIKCAKWLPKAEVRPHINAHLRESDRLYTEAFGRPPAHLANGLLPYYFD